jgi:hypothetical protein
MQIAHLIRMKSIWTTGPTRLGTAWLVLLVGAWLVISPFALGFAHYTAGIANNIAVGLALILLTLGSTRNGLLRAAMVLMGAWMWASAFILGVPREKYMWNNLILAFVVILSAVASETPYPPNYRPN